MKQALSSHGRVRPHGEGAVFVETLLVLPLLGTLLAAALGVHAIYATKLEATSRARRLAWLAADSGRCPETSCAGGTCDAAARGVRQSGVDALHSVRSSRFSLRSFVGDLREFFVAGATSSVETATKELPIFFGRATRQSGRHALVCNTTPGSAPGGDSILDRACQTDLRHSEYAGAICD